MHLARARPLRSTIVAVAALGTCLAAPGAAQATDYCVSAPACVAAGGVNKGSDLQGALGAAQSNGGADVVRIGPGTFKGEFFYTAPADNPVDIRGAGVGKTLLTAPTVTDGAVHDVLFDDNDGGSVSNLAVRLPAGPVGKFPSTRGIDGSTNVHDVVITAPADAVGPVGVDLEGSVRRSTILIPKSISGSGAIRVQGDFVGEDLTLSGYYGVYQDGHDAPDGAEVFLRRTRISALRGVGTYDESSNIQDSLIQVDPGGLGVDAQTHSGSSPSSSPASSTVTLENSTIVGGQYSVRAKAQSAVKTLHVVVKDSILHGASSGALRRENTGGSVTLTVTYSNYLGSSSVGAGTTSTANNTNFTDPGFFDATHGDYRLIHTSPVIDQGDPAALIAGVESTTDLRGLPRVRDGNGVGGPRRDMGAFEYQRSAPVARAIASPSPAGRTQPITFDATGSSDFDPDDILSFAWSFDDGTTDSGHVVQHAFSTVGAHAATVTATDTTGQHSTTSVTVAVVTPAVSKLRVSPQAFKPAASGASIAAAGGALVSYRLNEAAAVRFRVERRVTGRRVKGKCVRVRRSNRKRKHCSRYVGVKGSFTHTGKVGANAFGFTGRLRGKKLKPGRYRLVANPRDAAGNTGPAVRARFRVK
jgi:hypothetical protein